MMSPISLIYLAMLVRAVAGFTFSHSDPVECQNMTLRWQGGTPPFYATVVPAYPISGARIQNISIPVPQSSDPYQHSFRLDNPRGLEFSVIMSDATGWGAGGVTPVLQVEPSSDQSCHTTPPPFGFYFYWDPPMSISSAQCQSLRLSWDSGLTYPIQALGFVPGSAAFTIPVPQNPSDLSTTWQVSIREGAQYQLLMAHSGQVTTGGSTNLTWVTSGSGSCLNANSPGPGVRVATVISAGTSNTRSLTSMSMRPTASVSGSARPESDNSGGGISNGGGVNAGAIAGGVIGGIAAIALLVLLLFCCRRRRQRQNNPPSTAAYAQSYTAEQQPEMRQSQSLAPAAVIRRATRSMGGTGTSHSRHPSRTSFDILSAPSAAAHSPGPAQPTDLDTPSVSDETADPFVSPFPAPPPRASFDRNGPNAVAWGARADNSEGLGLGLGQSVTPLPPAPVLAPLRTSDRQSRKVSGSFSETPPLTPTHRPTSAPRSPMYTSPSSGRLTRWSVDDDDQLGSRAGTGGRGSVMGEMGRGQRTTFVQHDDAGPGGVVELPPSYNQLRPRNPDESP